MFSSPTLCTAFAVFCFGLIFCIGVNAESWHVDKTNHAGSIPLTAGTSDLVYQVEPTIIPDASVAVAKYTADSATVCEKEYRAAQSRFASAFGCPVQYSCRVLLTYKSNADRLAQELKAKGYKVMIDNPLPSSPSSPFWGLTATLPLSKDASVEVKK